VSNSTKRGPTAAQLNSPIRRFPAVDRHLAQAMAVAYWGKNPHSHIRRAYRAAVKLEARAVRKGVRNG